MSEWRKKTVNTNISSQRVSYANGNGSKKIQ
jgi:hypothetical protein